jgi:hypothetical protein
MYFNLGEGPNCESNYTMSFLVPALLQGTAPAPTDATVYLEDRAALRLAALQFDGIPHDLDFTMRAAELYGLATEAGVQVCPQIYTYSRYWIAVNNLVRAMEGSLDKGDKC